jgi:hypothetical protein
VVLEYKYITLIRIITMGCINPIGSVNPALIRILILGVLVSHSKYKKHRGVPVPLNIGVM